MAEQAKVPAIRFAGFTDPWEQRKFVDFVEASGIRNKDNLQLESYSVSNDRGFVPQDEQFENGGTMRDADKTAYWIVEPGSFAYNPARINVGSIGYQSTRKNVIVSSLYEVFKTDHSCDDRFLWHWFKSSLFTKQIEMLQEGGVRLYFFFDKLQKSEIWMPNVDEQRIIGQQFDQLDSLITLHQRKYDKLVIFKKSMLEKMFPKDGESVPEIRFAGFTDPWEQRKASEVFQIVDDRGHPTLPVLSATQNQGMIYRDDSGRYIGHDESNEIGYKRVLPGDFVVHLRSFQGGFAHSQYEGITSPAYTVFRAKEPTSHSDRFWKHWFISEHFIAGLSTVTYGIRDGRSISVDEFMNTFLAFPAVEEQAAISRLLDYLDDLITLHQRKLELLQNIKKSLLDKMFV